MLCEKCKNKGGDCKMTAQGDGFVMGFSGRHPVHQSDGKWFPGGSKKDLEDWCAKNCKPAKPVELVKEVKEVKEEITPPSPLKDKGVQSSNKNATDKKKD
jgi:hypothetical protein